MVRVSFCAAFALAFFSFQGCGPATVAPTLDVSARPRSIDNKTGTAVITVNATDSLGKVGTGKVSISSSAGSLKAGDTITLADGAGTIDFSCRLADDPTCLGNIVIDTSWTVEGKKTTATTNLTVTAPPAPDAGQGDGGTQPGFDAGVVDGGTFGEYSIALTFEKAILLRGSGDSMQVTAKVTRTATPLVGVPNAPVLFTVSGGGSFSAVALSSKMVTTDSNGEAKTTLFVGTATSTMVVTAAAFDASAFQGISAVNVAKIEFVPDSRTKQQLTIKSTGRDSSTPVFFKVTDSTTAPVKGVEVLFGISAGSAAGCTVAASSITDADGIAQTLLSSGEASGSVTVRAVVGPTANTANELLATRAFSIIIGRPSDGKFRVQCTRKILGALQADTVPRNDLSTGCTVSLADRFSTILPFSVDVNWQAEAGLLTSTTSTDPGTGTTNNTYRTGTDLPVETDPQVGEPSQGSNNPRDMFVTIIASTNGEEEFWDLATDGGVGNGVWDPGEWFVDLPEPFIDANDNGVFDSNEKFSDTERIDCTTGIRQPKNGSWDGPNGCWDSSTVIWTVAHVIYAGNLGNAAPLLQISYPVSVGNNLVSATPFRWTDKYFNRLSNDGANLSVAIVSGTRGSAAIIDVTYGETFGHSLSYYTAKGTTSNGVITETGGCSDIDRMGAPAAGVRCFRRFKVATWSSNQLTGTLQITGPPPADMPANNTPTTFQLSGGNSLATPTRPPSFLITWPN